MKKITLPNLKKVLGVTKNQEKEDIKALNSALAVFKGYYKGGAVNLKTFCDDTMNLYKNNNTILIPYKIKFTADFSPNKTESWFRGYVVLQNMNYAFSEVGNIVAHSSVGTYMGVIKTANGNPIIIWKTISTY